MDIGYLLDQAQEVKTRRVSRKDIKVGFSFQKPIPFYLNNNDDWVAGWDYSSGFDGCHDIGRISFEVLERLKSKSYQDRIIYKAIFINPQQEEMGSHIKCVAISTFINNNKPHHIISALMDNKNE